MTYVIWSFEHNRWWGPNHCGYVDELSQAGSYTEGEAGHIVTGSVLLDEVAVPIPMAIAFGPPKHHPYGGDHRGAMQSKCFVNKMEARW